MDGSCTNALLQYICLARNGIDKNGSGVDPGRLIVRLIHLSSQTQHNLDHLGMSNGKNHKT